MNRLRRRYHVVPAIVAAAAGLAIAGVSMAGAPATPTAAAPATTQEPQSYSARPDDLSQRGYSPYADRSFPDRVFFGDTHLHTELSPDAGLLGTNLDVHDAYRFARGETVISNTGQRVQLARPLDFVFVTDHAEYIGLAGLIRESDPALLSDDFGRFLYNGFNEGGQAMMEAFGAILEDAANGVPRFDSPETMRSIWNSLYLHRSHYCLVIHALKKNIFTACVMQ